MPTMTDIELDIAADQTEDQVRDWAETFGCTADLIHAEGPGGGNPVYLFKGTTEAVAALDADYPK